MNNSKVDHAFLKALNFEQEGEVKKAISSYQLVLKNKPSPAVSAAAYNNLGILEKSLNQIKLSFKHFKRALEIDPNLDTAHFNLGNIFQFANDHKNALISFVNTIKVNPKFHLALPNIYFSMRQLCLWKYLDELSQKIDLLPADTETPFISLIRTDRLERNLHSAQNRATQVAQVTAFLRKNNSFKFSPKKKKRLTIGYVSDGFRNYPTTQNLIGVLENHNKNRFKIIAYSLRKKDSSEYCKRVIKSVNKFVELTNLSSWKAAQTIYNDQVDILVDLKGFTENNRFEIFTYKPSPIQVNFLGFIGSTGSSFHNYMVADNTVVPKLHQKYYTEKIIYLPHTYWPTDSKLLQKIEPNKFKQKKNIIFCSFNRSYKIEESTFNTWLRILKQVPNSKLQLLKTSTEAKNNLLKYVKKVGIEKSRINFLKSLPKIEHIERLKKADIALDTYKIGGHTTTIDALVAGVPVITILGNHFASRVSASMLKAVGLPELITHSLKEYEDLAVKIAKSPMLLKKLKEKLAQNLTSYPLFDTKTYTKDLEKTYEIMWQNYLSTTEPKNHPRRLPDF